MKAALIAAVLLLTGCSATHVQYALGTGISPQRAQELEAQRVQAQAEAQRDAERAENWRTRCSRHHCKSAQDLMPKRINCDDPDNYAQYLTCTYGVDVTTVNGVITEFE